MSVSGDAVLIEENEENEEGMVDEDGEADPRLAAGRWRRTHNSGRNAACGGGQ